MSLILTKHHRCKFKLLNLKVQAIVNWKHNGRETLSSYNTYRLTLQVVYFYSIHEAVSVVKSILHGLFCL